VIRNPPGVQPNVWGSVKCRRDETNETRNAERGMRRADEKGDEGDETRRADGKQDKQTRNETNRRQIGNSVGEQGYEKGFGFISKVLGCRKYENFRVGPCHLALPITSIS
jgi:hypothetical protein